MNLPSYRTARSTGMIALTTLLLLVVTCFQQAHAGLDEGSFDLSQPASLDPVAWAWSPNSTSDGDGVEFVASLSAFQHAGAVNPSVTTTADYRPGTSHQTLQDFVNWIIANNPNVLHAGQLTIVKRVVTTVTLP
jgi:hypothetical protein